MLRTRWPSSTWAISRPTELDRHRDFVLMNQKIACSVYLDHDVVFPRFRTKADFFRLYLVGMPFAQPLFLLVLEFTVIHDAANRRVFFWRNLNQVKAGLLGLIKCLFGGYYAQLLAVRADDSHRVTF